MSEPVVRELEGRTVVDFGDIWFVVEESGRIMARQPTREPGAKYMTVAKFYPTRGQLAEVRRILKRHNAQKAV